MAEKLNIRGMNIEARCKPSDQGLEIWRLAGFTHQSNFTYQTLVEWSFFSKKKKTLVELFTEKMQKMQDEEIHSLDVMGDMKNQTEIQSFMLIHRNHVFYKSRRQKRSRAFGMNSTK